MDLLAMEGYAMHDYIHAGNAHYIRIFGKFQQAALGRLGRSGCTTTTVYSRTICLEWSYKGIPGSVVTDASIYILRQLIFWQTSC